LVDFHRRPQFIQDYLPPEMLRGLRRVAILRRDEGMISWRFPQVPYFNAELQGLKQGTQIFE